MRHNAKAFTLIGLLVVVLIIGILAAVALPQYQKAVAKARLTEDLVFIDTAKKQIDLHVLEHGQEVRVKNNNNSLIELPTNSWNDVVCGEEWCSITSYHKDASENLLYVLDVYGYVQDEEICPGILWGYTQNDRWYQGCWTNNTAIGKAVCQTLEPQGWKMMDDEW